MIKKLGLTAFFLFFLSSCYTIHFRRAGWSGEDYQFSQWHHIGFMGLMEFSPPVNLKAVCSESSWGAVRVQTGLLQGLVKTLSIPITIINFYSPEEVSISCKK